MDTTVTSMLVNGHKQAHVACYVNYLFVASLISLFRESLAGLGDVLVV